LARGLVIDVGLERLAGRTNEIAQNGNVWAVSADAPGIHGQTETLGKLEIHTRVVQLRQAESLRGQHAIYARRIDRPRRAVTPPRAPRQLVKLFPIAFVPSRHFFFDPTQSGSTYLSANTFASILWMRARPIRFTSGLPRIASLRNNFVAIRPIHILHKSAVNGFSLPIVSNTLRCGLFCETAQGTMGAVRCRGILHTFLLINQRAIPFANAGRRPVMFHCEPSNTIGRTAPPKVRAGILDD
jgi:hypothetical protein